MDLRRPLAESILIIGGTAMLPGFIPRLRSELLHRLFLSTPPIPPDPSILATSTNRVKNQSLAAKRLTNRLHLLRTSPRFAPLVPLGARLRLINSNAVSTGTYASSTSFAPSLIGWIGGSLAGSMKLAGEEMKKEKWEEIVRSGEKMRIMEDWSSKKWDAMLL
jgi:actin-related protein 10